MISLKGRGGSEVNDLWVVDGFEAPHSLLADLVVMCVMCVRSMMSSSHHRRAVVTHYALLHVGSSLL
jgi:hypothetical protein